MAYKNIESFSLTLVFVMGIFLSCNFIFIKIGHAEPESSRLLEHQSKADQASLNKSYGLMYFEGENGFRQDFVLAEKYFIIAAEDGNSEARSIMDDAKVKCREHKNMGSVSHVLKYCFLAAYLNDPQGMYKIGIAYNTAKVDLTENNEKAFLWLNRCARLGHSGCQVYLGMLYDKGQAVVQNKLEAYVWFSLADIQDDLSDLQKKIAKTVKEVLYANFLFEERQEADQRFKEYSLMYLTRK